MYPSKHYSKNSTCPSFNIKILSLTNRIICKIKTSAQHDKARSIYVLYSNILNTPFPNKLIAAALPIIYLLHLTICILSPILPVQRTSGHCQSIFTAAKFSASLHAVHVTSLLRQWHPLAQLVEALHYKSEGRGFDSRWCHWNFPLT